MALTMLLKLAMKNTGAYYELHSIRRREPNTYLALELTGQGW